MRDTIRELCLKALLAHLSSMKKDEPDADPYPFTWSLVSRTPLTEQSRRKQYALGIHDTEESKDYRIGTCVQCTLRVVLEFFVMVQANQDASEQAGIVLGVLQRRLLEDNTLGGVAIDCKETSNSVYIDAENDRTINGAMVVELKYRHGIRDPRDPV